MILYLAITPARMLYNLSSMRTLLVCSLAANIAFIGLASAHLAGKRSPSHTLDAAQSLGTATPSVVTSLQPVAPPFDWSQIEADDYPTYISNLRAVGCPELTIRRIVSAEIGDAFAAKRQELQTQNRTAVSQVQLDDLREEEAHLLRSLLPSLRANEIGPEEAGHSITTTPDNNFSQTSARAPVPASLPLAFQIGSSTSALSPARIGVPAAASSEAVNLSEVHQQAIAQLQSKFLEEIGGENQNPNDPEYYRRWQKARPVLDEQLKIMLGNDLFNRYQIQAAQQEQAARQGR